MATKYLILGAGYGGLMTAKGLAKSAGSDAEITLVNQNPYHYFTTELHKPAAGTTHHDHARVSIPSVLPSRVKFVEDKVTSIKLDEKKVILEKNSEGLSYDYLVIGLGSAPETFGIKGLLENAFFIRSIDSVRMIREHMEYMFARYKNDPKDEYLTIVVGGAGFTGIEYVGELVDRVPELCREYDLPKDKVRIVNIEAAPTVLPGFDKELVEYGVNYLKSKGVQFYLGVPIEECTDEGVILKGGEEIKAATVVWTGGVRGNKLVEDSGIETMRGRVKVDGYLHAPGHDDVFVLGDSSLVFPKEEGARPYPPTAQISTQQGQYLGQYLPQIVKGQTVPEFEYKPKGTVASLGGKVAIGFVGDKKLFGGNASFMKKLIDIRWLYLLGGISLVLRKGKL